MDDLVIFSRSQLVTALLLTILITRAEGTFFIHNSDNLIQIPANISNETTDIILKSNQIATVSPGDLADLPFLRRIDLTKNKLTELPDFCSVGQTLKILTLRFNVQLVSIPLSHLDCLSVLYSLDLSTTGLTTAPDLTPIKDTLLTLYLGYLDLVSFPDGYFDGFSKLQLLDLTNNNFVAIPDIAPVGDTLIRLSMMHNALGNIDAVTWQNMTRLAKLSLEHNNMTVFPDLRLMAATLTDVYVDFNPLVEINSTLIQELVNLQRIGFGGDNIDELPDLTGLDDSLLNLRIQYSQLLTVPNLGNMTAMEVYSIKNNMYITSIPYDYFTGWNSLQVLDITDVPITALPNLKGIADTLTALYITGSAITTLPLDQMMRLTKLETLDLRRTEGITTVPVMCTLNPKKLTVDTRGADVDLCHCDNLWLLYAKQIGASVRVDSSVSCKGIGWSSHTTATLGKKCHTEIGEYRHNRPGVHAKSYFCGFPLLVYHDSPGYLHCTKRCIDTSGCTAFNFRRQNIGTSQRSCTLVAPVADGTLMTYEPAVGEPWNMMVIEQVLVP